MRIGMNGRGLRGIVDGFGNVSRMDALRVKVAPFPFCLFEA